MFKNVFTNGEADREQHSINDSLNVSFGRKLRALIGIGLLAPTLGGCGPSEQEVQRQVAALPHRTPSQVVLGQANLGLKVAVTGNLEFARDESYSTTAIVPIMVSNGKTSTTLMLPQTTHHTRLWYGLTEQGSNERLSVFATHQLPTGAPVIVSGEILPGANGGRYLRSEYVLENGAQ